MKNLSMNLLCIALGFFTAFSAMTVRAADPVPKKVTEKIELFNGKDFTNWYIFLQGHKRGEDPDNVFTIKDGMIRISGKTPGCITTNDAYRDYQIIIEYKWGDKLWSKKQVCYDSGLLFHSIGEDGAWHGIWQRSIEANIIEGGVGDFIVVGNNTDDFQLTVEVAPEKSPKNCYIWKKGGEKVTVNSGRIDWFGRDPAWENVRGFRGKNDVDKPVGEWNQMKVICDGDKVDVYNNGVLVNQALKVKPAGGRIQIQSEISEIFIRRVTLLPIDK